MRLRRLQEEYAGQVEFVWRSYSTNTWVAFKTFGIMPLTLVFSITLLPLINRHQIPAEASPTDEAAEAGGAAETPAKDD